MREAELLTLWDELAAEDPKSSGVDRRRLAPLAPLDLFACVFWPGGQVGLLIETAGATPIPRERLPGCRGLSFRQDVFRGAKARQSLMVQLESTALREVFAVLAADLVTAAAGAGSAEEGLARALDRIAMWKGLLEQLPATGLTPQAQRGLLGELVVLERLHLAALDPLQAVLSWNGPGRAYQDFDTAGVAVEVKTSLAKRHTLLTITSERQLDETPLRALYLAHVALAESTTGMSLPRQVAAIRELLAGDHAALSEFNLRLVASGYLDSQAEVYEENRYGVPSIRLFEVRDHFPRLTGAMLPAGVGGLTYTIVADDLTTFEIAMDSVSTTIGAADA
jgi:hypothetical protein